MSDGTWYVLIPLRLYCPPDFEWWAWVKSHGKLRMQHDMFSSYLEYTVDLEWYVLIPSHRRYPRGVEFNILMLYAYNHNNTRVRKRLLKVCMWEVDRTELKYFDPQTHGRQRCVFLVLLMLNRSPWAPLCWVLAFFTASYQQLL